MHLSPEGAAFLRRHEGFVDHVYADPVGILTIGIGFTWRSVAFRGWWTENKPGVSFARGATMTRQEADAALIFLCNREYGKAVNEFMSPLQIRQHVFDAMTSVAYNLGPGSLKWKWAAAVKAGDLVEAAARLVNTGTTAKGRKLAGLARRRNEEAALLRFGDYGSAAALVHPDPMADGVLVRGERGRAVLALQKQLLARGFYTGALDSVFGYGTEAAVLAFQRANGLNADGHAGPITLAALSAKPATPPAPKTPAGEPQKPGNWVSALVAFLVAILKGMTKWSR